MTGAEKLARSFHEAYERLAPQFGYETRRASAVPWEDVPEQNKALMIATCAYLLADGVWLTADEAEKVRHFIDWVLSSGMPDWDDVERGEAEVLALLIPEGKDDQ